MVEVVETEGTETVTRNVCVRMYKLGSLAVTAGHCAGQEVVFITQEQC